MELGSRPFVLASPDMSKANNLVSWLLAPSWACRLRARLGHIVIFKRCESVFNDSNDPNDSFFLLLQGRMESARRAVENSLRGILRMYYIDWNWNHWTFPEDPQAKGLDCLDPTLLSMLMLLAVEHVQLSTFFLLWRQGQGSGQLLTAIATCSFKLSWQQHEP